MPKPIFHPLVTPLKQIGTLREDFSHIQLGLVRQPRCQRRWHEKRLPWPDDHRLHFGLCGERLPLVQHLGKDIAFRADVQLLYHPSSLRAPWSAVLGDDTGWPLCPWSCVVRCFSQCERDGHPLVAKPLMEPSLPPPHCGARIVFNIHDANHCKHNMRATQKGHTWLSVGLLCLVVASGGWLCLVVVGGAWWWLVVVGCGGGS